MLAADKDALKQSLRLHMLEIQQRELDYLTNNLANLSTVSAVLLGFAITLASSVNEVSPNTSGGGGPPFFCLDGWVWGAHPAEAGQNCPMPKAVVYTFDGLFALFTGLAIGCNVITLFLSSTVLMAGPGLALRGPEGSLNHAVRHMEAQNKRALRFFGRGLAAFAFSMFFLGVNFALYDQGPWRGAILCLTMVWTLGTLLHYGTDIIEKFYLSPDYAVRGQFTISRSGKTEWVRPRSDSGASAMGRPRGRWRPPGHGVFTPLLRLDKILTFPYYDARQIARETTSGSARFSPRGSGPASARSGMSTSASAKERGAVEGLLRAQQDRGEPVTQGVADAAVGGQGGGGAASDESIGQEIYDAALSTLRDLFAFGGDETPATSRAPPPPTDARASRNSVGGSGSVRFERDGQGSRKMTWLRRKPSEQPNRPLVEMRGRGAY